MIVRHALAILVTLTGIAGASGIATTTALYADSASIGSNTFTTTTLSAPTGLTATASCNGTNSAKVSLSWTAATSADGYDLARSIISGGPYSFLVHATTTSHLDTGLSVATTYYYVVRTTNDDWTSSYSSQVSATTPSVCL